MSPGLAGNAWYKRTGPDGVDTCVVLDDTGRVSCVRRGPELDPIMTATYTYYANRLPETVTYQDASTVNSMIEYQYDAANRVTVIDHRNGLGTTILKLTYAYYDNDLPEEIVERGGADQIVATTHYDYDSRGRLTDEWRVDNDPASEYNYEYEYDHDGNRITKTDNTNQQRVDYYYDYEDPEQHGSANNRLVRYRTVDTSLGFDRLLSTTWYYYNAAGNVLRVVTLEGADTGGGQQQMMAMGGPGDPCALYGGSQYKAVRFDYARNGRTVTYAFGETWCWDGSPCSNYGPENYNVTFAREFRHDSARERYLVRELDPFAAKVGMVSPRSGSRSTPSTWSDYGEQGERTGYTTGKASRDARVRSPTCREGARKMRATGGDGEIYGDYTVGAGWVASSSSSSSGVI